MNQRYSSLIVCVCSAWWLAIGCGAAPDPGSPSPAKPPAGQLSDGQILAIYNQVNGFDIETGQLGDARGASEDVRTLGGMVVADHTAVRELATKLGVTLGIEPMLPAERAAAAAEHAGTIAKLRALSGAEFDRAYLRHEIRFHRDAIQAVGSVLIPAAARAELKQLMTDVLPGFQHHLDETLRVAAKLGYQ